MDEQIQRQRNALWVEAYNDGGVCGWINNKAVVWESEIIMDIQEEKQSGWARGASGGLGLGVMTAAGRRWEAELRCWNMGLSCKSSGPESKQWMHVNALVIFRSQTPSDKEEHLSIQTQKCISGAGGSSGSCQSWPWALLSTGTTCEPFCPLDHNQATPHLQWQQPNMSHRHCVMPLKPHILHRRVHGTESRLLGARDYNCFQEQRLCPVNFRHR